MATIVKESSTDDRGLGVAGVVIIILAILLAAFFLFRWTGSGGQTGGGSGADVEVSGSLNGNAAGSY